MTKFETRVLESFYKVDKNKNTKEYRQWVFQNRQYLFDTKYKQSPWFHWLIERNISFKLEEREVWNKTLSEINPTSGKIVQKDIYNVYLFVLFEKRNDHLLFELTWKGRYDGV